MRHISVSLAVWRKINNIKKKHGFMHYSKTLEFLLENQPDQPDQPDVE